MHLGPSGVVTFKGRQQKRIQFGVFRHLDTGQSYTAGLNEGAKMTVSSTEEGKKGSKE